MKTLIITAIFFAAFLVGQEADKEWKVDQFNTTTAKFIAEDILPGFTDDVKVLVGPHERGWAERDDRRIIIPTWAFAKDKVKPGYSRYYICHEMAHIETIESSSKHKANFNVKLEELCPDVSFYEKDYDHS